MPPPTAADLIVELLPMIIPSLPLAISVFWLAPKMRSNPWIWAVLFLIPVVNLFAMQNAIAPVAAAGESG